MEERKWGGGWGKNGRNKDGGITICYHLFISTSCNYDYAKDGKVFLL